MKIRESRRIVVEYLYSKSEYGNNFRDHFVKKHSMMVLPSRRDLYLTDPGADLWWWYDMTSLFTV